MKPFFKAVQVVVQLDIQLTNALRRIGDGCVVSIDCSFAILQAGVIPRWSPRASQTGRGDS